MRRGMHQLRSHIWMPTATAVAAAPWARSYSICGSSILPFNSCLCQIKCPCGLPRHPAAELTRVMQNGANIRARAWGTFFRPDGPMYYGEYPLSFAACTGQKDVVAYLKRHGARVRETTAILAKSQKYWKGQCTYLRPNADRNQHTWFA
eukprot:GHUV01030258.1.p1 GENE.GHUV01030258.1~~GHUV01030258.1.p1  ORF type:complete len:149 (+),score=13.37 GHUV01030258.1:141-587(+)